MRTLIIFNHPYEGSFCNAILDAAILGLQEAGQEVDLIHLDKDGFNPVMSSTELKAFVLAREEPERALMMLDAKVLDYKARLEKADHLLFIFPVWWMLMPALTKGFIDKVIFPAVAYNYGDKGQMLSRLWNLRRVTVITTMATHADVYAGEFGNAVWKVIEQGTFGAIGIEHCRWMNFAGINSVSRDKRGEWLRQVREYMIGVQ